MKRTIRTGKAITTFRSYSLILSFQFTVSQDSVSGINVANQTISAHSRANHFTKQTIDDFLLIDVRHSYQGLCKLLKGCYFTYDSSDPFCFNPFLIANYTEVSKDKKESLKTLLLALWKRYGQSYSRNEGITLSNVIVQASVPNTLTSKVNSLVNSTTRQLYNSTLSMTAIWAAHTSRNWEKSSYRKNANDSYEESYLKDKIQNQN